MKDARLVPLDLIEQRILFLRGQRVMFDRDLAELYCVETKYLNRQVRRNKERFPREFMFQLTKKERDELVTNWHRFASLKHSSVLPYAFTEHGVAMLSSVLHGKRAIQINILIIKVFVKLRKILAKHKELSLRLKELEMRIDRHDDAISAMFETIRQLTALPEKPKHPIGF